MGGYQTKRTEDEVEAEKERILRLSLNSRRSEYGDEYTALETIKTWQRYYDENITASERNVETFEQVNDAINQKVSLFRGDITRLEVDAIVNSAAKPGKGQVNSAIMQKAGEFYRDECLHKGLRAPGEALVTGGYKLPSKYVINVLAPPKKQLTILENCYRNSLFAAKQNRLRSVAFPCIATRKRNRFPLDEAAHIAARVVRSWMNQYGDSVDRVIFCVYTLGDVKAYRSAMQAYFPVISRNTPEYPCPISSGDEGEASTEETSFMSGTDGSSTDSSIDSSAGAAAPRKPPEDLRQWRLRTQITGYNQEIEIDRMEKHRLFKKLLRIYTDKDVNLACRLSIKFTAEEGVDLGALSREYFSQAMDTLSSVVYRGSPSFEGQVDHKLPTASKIHVDDKIFDVIGKVIAHSVLHEGMGFVGLCPAIVYLLTHPIKNDEVSKSEIPICVEDVANLELKELLEMSSESCQREENKSKLLDFMHNYNIGYMHIDDSTINYIKQELMVYEIVNRRWSQIEALRNGMDSVRRTTHNGNEGVGLYTFLCENPTQRNIQAVFPKMADIQSDPDEIVSRTLCHHKHTATWAYFVDFLKEIHAGKIDEFKLSDVIAFWTGHPLLPREGLNVEVEHSSGLPTASTCFLTLLLPLGHKTYKDFRDAFTAALKHGAKGFGEM